MSYCTNCGHELDHEPLPEAVVDEAEVNRQAEVEIAKIQADRDIQLAKIQARIVESEVATENAALEAENEVLGDVVEAITAPDEPEQSAPIVIEAPAVAQAEPDDFDNAMPASDQAEHHEHSRKRAGLGMW
jgi:hypothetical protein